MIFLKRKILILASLILLLIFSSCEKDISTSPPEEEPPQGFLFVDSNPQNYKIYLDGRFTGRFTPDTLPYVEETEHLIGFKKKYWLDSSESIIAEREVTKSLYVDFMKDPRTFGSIRFISRPEKAIIQINDSLTTLTTPDLLTGLVPGFYNIAYHLPKHRSISARTLVQSNKTALVSLALQDTSVWVDFTTSNSEIPSNTITTLAVDSTNTIWAGTINKGVVSIKGNKWRFLNTTNSGLLSDRIRVIEVSKNNAIWIGTDDGLCEYKNGSIQRVINVGNSPLTQINRINTIAFLNDFVLAGTAEGLLKIEKDTTLLYKVVDVEGNNEVTSLATDEINNIVWIGMKGRILSYEVIDNKFVANPKAGDVGSTVFNLDLAKLKIRPSDGRLWALFSTKSGIGQEGDLVHVTPYLAVWTGTDWLWQRLSSENMILTDAIVSKDDYVWISTNDGLRKYNTLREPDEVIKAYNTGLFSDDLTSIEVDANGTFWLGSADGLYKYKRK